MGVVNEGEGQSSPFRRFVLVRHKDESGVSGTGTVVEGVQFSTGKVALIWLTEFSSVAIYDSMKEVLRIHGHSGYTEVQWIDGDEPCYQRP